MVGYHGMIFSNPVGFKRSPDAGGGFGGLIVRFIPHVTEARKGNLSSDIESYARVRTQLV